MSILSGGFAAMIMWQLNSGAEIETLLDQTQSGSPLPAAAPAARPTPDDAARQVAAILSRPLFDPRRQPTAGAASDGDAVTIKGLPRLTGLVISPTARTAVFAPEAGTKPVAAAEGARIGQYVIQSIGNGEATLLGPDGQVTLRPTFANPARQQRSAPKGVP